MSRTKALDYSSKCDVFSVTPFSIPRRGTSLVPTRLPTSGRGQTCALLRKFAVYALNRPSPLLVILRNLFDTSQRRAAVPPSSKLRREE